MAISTKQSVLGSIAALVLGLSCCWLPALIILLGGATGALGFADQLEGFSGIFLTIGACFLAYGGYRYWKAKQEPECRTVEPTTDVILESTITCPHCNHSKSEVMPTDACQYFYECEGCKTILKPKSGDCCVYCSYGTVPCPPIQQNVSCCS